MIVYGKTIERIGVSKTSTEPLKIRQLEGFDAIVYSITKDAKGYRGELPAIQERK